MSWFRNVGGFVALGVLAASVACGGSSSTTAPTATSLHRHVQRQLTQGGTDFGPADSPHHFTAHQAGNIDATLTDIQPLNTITLGLGLGVWDATAQTCTLQVSSAKALNLTLAANTGAAGELCVGVFDVGNITSDVITYTVTVNHT